MVELSQNTLGTQQQASRNNPWSSSWKISLSDPDAGVPSTWWWLWGPAGVCLCKFGASSITIVPTSQQEKTAMWQNAITKSVLEATLLDLTLSTVSSAVSYLGHHYYHTVATLEKKLPVRKGASCSKWNFLDFFKVKLHKFFSKASFQFGNTNTNGNPVVNGGSDKMNENCYK